MMTIRISTNVVAALILWTLTATVPAAWAACYRLPEEGVWKNIDATTSGRITRVQISFPCNDVCYNNDDCLPPFYGVRVWSACHPTDCDWGWNSVTQWVDGWLFVTYPSGLTRPKIPSTTNYVWFNVYEAVLGVDYLRVVVRHEYPAPHLGPVFDGWFLRAELVGEAMPVDPKVEPEGSQLAR